jgi:hypothetical protein
MEETDMLAAKMDLLIKKLDEVPIRRRQYAAPSRSWTSIWHARSVVKVDIWE